jgi:hypothetical protein
VLNAAGLTARFQTLHGHPGGIQKSGVSILPADRNLVAGESIYSGRIPSERVLLRFCGRTRGIRRSGIRA